MKYIDADKLIAEIERRMKTCAHEGTRPNQREWETLLSIKKFITSLQQEQPEVQVECYVRVYPTLDNKPRPWVALCRHGIGCNSIRDIPELETLGFEDDDTAIVTIKKK